ncbi:MAG: F0F1 ATP synthase subunit A [Pseudobdellovibrionaceae bacterium]|nr:F0F1 ATP synthase subunit A [Bdellovibrionales bacterium]USN49018.1 MAG: F0F1 ATP synthase subunit A [Pseudobdellovibrionaceae bacterium]
MHFNWTQLIPEVGHDYIHVATAAGAGTVLVGLSVLGKMALGGGETAVLPADRFSLKGFFEVLTEFIVGLTDMVIGEEGRKFVPLFGALFFFLLFNNIVGLIPGMTPATDNLNTTLGLGLFAFLAYNYYGFKEHGIGYLKQFLGPLLPLAPLMLIIELISHFVRPASLGLRLQGNMMGDHTVLGIFLDLVPYGLPVIFYCLGLFVCFMQAFVFTLLTMIYVSLAISHDH